MNRPRRPYTHRPRKRRVMWERHQHDQALDREQLIPHLIIDHDMCDHPGLLYRASDEELATIHRRDHGEEPVAQGLFQWIHTPLPLPPTREEGT